MDYTSIHVYGHLLSDDILNAIERDITLAGNREQDFGIACVMIGVSSKSVLFSTTLMVHAVLVT